MRYTPAAIRAGIKGIDELMAVHYDSPHPFRSAAERVSNFLTVAQRGHFDTKAALGKNYTHLQPWEKATDKIAELAGDNVWMAAFTMSSPNSPTGKDLKTLRASFCKAAGLEFDFPDSKGKLKPADYQMLGWSVIKICSMILQYCIKNTKPRGY